MSDCIYNEEQIEAYHDGEVDSAVGLEMADHLTNCSACAALLVKVEGLSRLFSDAEPIRLSQIGMARLHANLELLTDRGLLRLARVMSGVAAAILVAGSLWLMRSRPAEAATPASAPLVALLEESSAAATVADPGATDWVVTELAR